MKQSLAVASALALSVFSAGAAWWVDVRDCDLGVGLPIAFCALWARPASDVPARRARRALRMAPLDGSAYRRLAQSAQAGGDAARATRLYRIALRRSPRELVARQWEFERAIASHRMADAAQAMDSLLTLDELSAPARLNTASRYLGDAVFSKTFAGALRVGRPWRSVLPAVLAETTHPVEVEALLARIADRGVSDAENALHARLLERLGRPQAARAQWRAALPPQSRGLDALLFDGGFEAPPGPPPYAWQFESQGGTAVGVDGSQAAEGVRSLAVVFDGRAADFTGVWQDLALRPGRYRLTLQATAHLSGARPIAWTLTCRLSGRPLARLELPSGHHAWQAYSVGFTVPPDCAAQQLRLSSIGRDLSERSVEGEVRFDALRIEDETTGASAR